MCGFSSGVPSWWAALVRSRPASRGVCGAEITGQQPGRNRGCKADVTPWHHWGGLRGSPQGLSAWKLQESCISLNILRPLAGAAASNALQPSMAPCCKKAPVPPQFDSAGQHHHPRMQLTQGASLAPQHRWVECIMSFLKECKLLNVLSGLHCDYSYSFGTVFAQTTA